MLKQILMLSFLAACSQALPTSQTKNVVADGGVWPSGNIPVCWEAEFMAQDSENDRSIIQAVIESQYNTRTLAIRFQGWAICPQEFSGVRVGIDNTTSPEVEALGYQVAGMKNGLTFNFDQINSYDRFPNLRDELLRFVALHEFGHVVGLMHEENHPDFQCADQGVVAISQDGAIPVGTFDPSSVMNNCFFRNRLARGTLPDATHLSDGDVAVIDQFYAGAIASPLSAECGQDGGRWSTMGRAFGCCFDFADAPPSGTAYTFCGAPEYTSHPLSQLLPDIHTALAEVCAKDDFGYDQSHFRCVAN